MLKQTFLYLQNIAKKERKPETWSSMTFECKRRFFSNATQGLGHWTPAIWKAENSAKSGLIHFSSHMKDHYSELLWILNPDYGTWFNSVSVYWYCRLLMYYLWQSAVCYSEEEFSKER